MKTQEQIDEESLNIDRISLVQRAGKTIIFSIIEDVVMGIHILESGMKKEDFDALTLSDVIANYPVNARRSSTLWSVIKPQVEVISEKSFI